MKIYNTLSGKKEEFIPLKDNNVKMYACGITVSGDAHIGHAYQALIYDIIRKYLELKGYKVQYARNYTDIDDKIIAKAKELHEDPMDFAKKTISRIDKVMKQFKVDEPTIWLRATTSIGNIISFISELIEKGHAYRTENGDVYFDVLSYPGYGKLSHRNIEDEMDGFRKENDINKKNHLDFALWKAEKEGEVSWDSPWGKGRPGWHIECSAMNREAFGDEIDIHGGGRDLIFPHHENEIAQTEALTGKRFAKYWIHNGLIKINGQKMSKSLGNTLLLEDLLNKYSDEAIKFALLQTNYRADINITDEYFKVAEKQLVGFYTEIAKYDLNKKIKEKAPEAIREEFIQAMDDDFNTAKAIANLFTFFKEFKKEHDEDKKIASILEIKKLYGILGLFRYDAKEFLKEYAKEEKVPEEIIALVQKRQEAKQQKNYALADAIRVEIISKGYILKDTKDGAEVEKA